MAEVPRNAFDDIGVTGLRRDKSRVFEEFLRQLSGTRAQATWREMSENDPIVVASLLGIEMYLRRIEWYVEHDDSEDDEDERVEFLNSAMHDMEEPWSSFVAEALSMLAFGFSLHEIVLKERVGPQESSPRRRSKHTDGKIGWRRFAPRAQDSLDEWRWTDDGELDGVWQRAWPDWKRRYIPRSKFLLFRTTHRKANPEGRSLLRGAFIPYMEKKRIRELQVVGIERDLTGIPLLRAPVAWFTDSQFSAQLDYMKKMGANIRNNEQTFVLLPSEYDDNKNALVDFELVGSPGQRQFDMKEEIAWRNLEIVMAMLTDVVLLGHEKIGTQALAVEKTDLATKAMEAWLDEIENVVNADAVPLLLELNGFDLEDAPRIKHAPVAKVSMTDLAETIKKLSDSGMEIWPSESMERFVRDVGGWPPLTDDEAEAMQAARERGLDELVNPPEPPEIVAPGTPGVGPQGKVTTTGAGPKVPPRRKPDPKQIAKAAMDAAEDPAALERFLAEAFGDEA